MGNFEKDRLAAAVADKWSVFQAALTEPMRRYPAQEFLSFAEAARRYIAVTHDDQLLHREVVKAINGLTEFLQEERKRVPGSILYEANRLECLFFLGYDPHFEGAEPPVCSPVRIDTSWLEPRDSPIHQRFA
jgi:hypothetical protein